MSFKIVPCPIGLLEVWQLKVINRIRYGRIEIKQMYTKQWPVYSQTAVLPRLNSPAVATQSLC